MSYFSVRPIYLESSQGRIFVIQHIPDDPSADEGVVLVPPFAEEMNKSRRMLNLLAELLASQGFYVLLPDFYGTGDSEGDFSEASWSAWREQLIGCIDGLASEFGLKTVSLVGLRTGALLAGESLHRCQVHIGRLILWQPVVDGSSYLTQFLRLQLATDMLNGQDEKKTVLSLKQRLSDGEVVEVAGYGLTSAITDGLAASSLKKLLPEELPPTCWINIVTDKGQQASLVNRNLVQCWRDAGVALQYLDCVGAPFWGGVEIIELPDVLTNTARFMSGDDGVGRARVCF